MKPTSRRPSTGPALSEADQWSRLTQSPVYIRRAAKVAKLVRAFLPARFKDKDSLTLNPAHDVPIMTHFILQQVQVEDTRRSRRSESTKTADAVPTTSATY